MISFHHYSLIFHQDISSSSEEEDVPGEIPVPRKKAATKRRTYKPVSADTVPSCGIYSTLQSNVGLGDLKFTNLPQGFSLGKYDGQVYCNVHVVANKWG